MSILFFSLLLLVQSYLVLPKAPVCDPSPAVDIIFQSSDNGETWEDISAGLPKDLQPWQFTAGEDDIYLGAESGLYRNQAITNFPGWQRVICPLEKVSGFFPGRAGLYAFSQESGFYQELPGSGIWLAVTNALENKMLHTFIESANGTILAGGDSGIFKSVDGMKTWRKVYDKQMVITLAEADGIVLAGELEGLMVSNDGGENWERTGMSYGRPMKIINIEEGLAAIFIDGDNWNQANAGGMRNNLLASYDHGRTWTRIDEGLPQIRRIRDVVKGGDFLYCSLETGIYRSSDLGKTWDQIRYTDGKTYYKLAFSGNRLYAMTAMAGC